MLRRRFEYNTHYTLCTRKSCKTWFTYVKKTFANNAKQIWRLFINNVLRDVIRNNSDELCQFTTYTFEWRNSLMKTYEEIDFQKKNLYFYNEHRFCNSKKMNAYVNILKKNILFHLYWKSECVHNKNHVLWLACEIHAKWCHFKTVLDACLKNKLTGLWMWKKWRPRA